MLTKMTLQIEQWRLVIGTFSGGNSGTSSKQIRGYYSSRLSRYQPTYLFFILVIFLSQFSGCVQRVVEYKHNQQRSSYSGRASSSSVSSDTALVKSLEISAESRGVYSSRNGLYLSRKKLNKLIKSENGNRMNR